MKMKSILLIISFCSSCITLNDKINSNNCCNSDNVKYNGYYFHLLGIPKYEQDSISKDQKIKTIYNNVIPIVFYKNGLVFYKRRGVTERNKFTDGEPYSSLPHEELKKYWTMINKNSCKSKKNLVGWGNYFFQGDSLIINYYDYKFQYPGWTSNKLVLKRIYGRFLNDSIIEININDYLTQRFYFVENTNIPDSENYRDKMK